MSYIENMCCVDWRFRSFVQYITVNSEIFVNSVKRHICDIKKSRIGHYLPISENDRVISSILKGLIFTKLRIFSIELNCRENIRIFSTLTFHD